MPELEDFVFRLSDSPVVSLGAHNSSCAALDEASLVAPLLRSRVVVHRSHADVPQIMVVNLARGSVVGMHRHPREKVELYLVLSGKLEVSYISTSGAENRIVYGPWGNEDRLPSLSIHRDGIWHEPRAVSQSCTYLEVYSGPFDKLRDVEYLLVKED